MIALLLVPNLVLSRTTYPADLDLDVILGISPGTTTIDYDQADFDEQAYGPSYDGDTAVRSGGSKSAGGEGSPDDGTSNKSGGRTRFMMMRADSDDNIDGPILSDTGADNNPMSAENNVVLGGTSGGTSGAISGEIIDPDPDLDADGSERGSGRTTRQASSTDVLDTPKRSKGNVEKTSTQASSNEITAAAASNEVTEKPQKSKNGGSKSTRQVNSNNATNKPNKSKDSREKGSNEVSSGEVTGKPNKSNGMTSAKPPVKPTTKSNGATTNEPKPKNVTFSSCFEKRQSLASQSDFCRFTNAVHGVCKAYFSNICSESLGRNQHDSYESESYASEESMDSEWSDYSLDSTDYDSLTASLESFGSSEMSDNEMKEVLKIVKGLCSNVCSAARKSNEKAKRPNSATDSTESGASSTVTDDAELSYNESDEVGKDASDTEDMSDEQDIEDNSGARRKAKNGGRTSTEKKQKKTQGSGGRNGNTSRKAKARGKNTNDERDNESESDSD